MSHESITMRQVAERAGVTQATVSMALSNHPRISTATRQRIAKLAEELGYKPNAYVSALMRARRQNRNLDERPVLALVSPFPTEEGWRSAAAPTVRQMLEGAIERAALRGFDAQEFWLHRDGMTNERFSDVLRSRGIQGILMGPLPAGAPAPALKWDYFSTVCLSAPFSDLRLTTVCNDHYFSSLQAVRECYRRGYRRAGLVQLRAHTQRFHGRWEAGLLIAQRYLAGMMLTEPLILETWNERSRLSAWFAEQRPDVIVTPGAELLLPELTEGGLRIPEDVGLVGLGLSSQLQPCSGIFQNGRLIGASGIDAVISMIERHEKGLSEQARTLMVEGIWCPGSTLGAVSS